MLFLGLTVFLLGECNIESLFHEIHSDECLAHTKGKALDKLAFLGEEYGERQYQRQLSEVFLVRFFLKERQLLALLGCVKGIS